jgi:translocation and assembly module TamA
VEFSEAELPQRTVGLKPGDPAVASEIRAAETRIINYFRKEGRPLAKIQSIAPVVDHAQNVMDVTVTAAPGPIAPFGEATINGPQTFDPAIVRSFLYIYPGDPYSPAAVADARNSIREIPAVGGVRITEGTALDPYGRLPYRIDVEDRLPYAIGASVKYSTTNGPEGQVYWEDRNVFGGAERLRLQASVFYAPPWFIASQSLRNFSPNDIGGRISASFLKPALWGTTNDLLIDALAEKISTSGAGFVGYQAEDTDVTASLRHRFNQNFWVQAGLEAQKGDATDALGTVNYTLVGVPVSANFDTTDSKLDPTRGVRVNVSAVGFGTFLGSSLDLVQAKAGASAYYSIDADSRYVLAGRVAAGAMGGPQLDEIPANWRFYAGGGGSVRGYAYNELGPTVFWGAVVGGKSLFDASAELRVKVTDTIGVVPFFDIGNAFASNFPNFDQHLFTAAGLGLRYYTSVGPIRLDVAFPLERHAGTGPVAVYVSIGQSF